MAVHVLRGLALPLPATTGFNIAVTTRQFLLRRAFARSVVQVDILAAAQRTQHTLQANTVHVRLQITQHKSRGS